MVLRLIGDVASYIRQIGMAYPECSVTCLPGELS